MALYRHRKYLIFRKLKNTCFLRKMTLFYSTLNDLRADPPPATPDQLSKKERQALIDENPHISPLYFMTQEEKEVYLEGKGREFWDRLERTPQRKSRNGKRVRFGGEEKLAFTSGERVVLESSWI